MKATTKQLLERAKKAADATSVMTTEERAQAVKDIEQALNDSPKWWVVVLKVLAYAIGLILAGYGTTAATLSIVHLL